jgi:hypothetical protein
MYHTIMHWCRAYRKDLISHMMLVFVLLSVLVQPTLCRYAQRNLSWHLSQLACASHPAADQAVRVLVHGVALNGEWLSHRVRAAAGSAASAQFDVRSSQHSACGCGLCIFGAWLYQTYDGLCLCCCLRDLFQVDAASKVMGGTSDETAACRELLSLVYVVGRGATFDVFALRLCVYFCLGSELAV